MDYNYQKIEEICMSYFNGQFKQMYKQIDNYGQKAFFAHLRDYFDDHQSYASDSVKYQRYSSIVTRYFYSKLS